MSSSAPTSGIIRQFQSESDALSETVRSDGARVTVLVLTALFVSAILIMCVTKVDRVVTSVNGSKLVSSQRMNVFQALDPSIIRSIEVREGDEVGAGQILATLDPTFAAADVKQLKQQVADSRAQIARVEAQLGDHPFVPPSGTDSDTQKANAVQQKYYDQQIAQYKAQLDSFDAKISQTEATIHKYEMDVARYQERARIAEQIEDMRATLAAHGTGSQYNLLTSQDSHIDLLRTLEYDKNSLVESKHTLTSQTADRAAFIQQWFAQLSQELVTTRNSLETADASLDKALRHHELVRLTALEPSVVLTVAKLSVGSVLKEGDTLFTLMPLKAPVEAEIHISARDIGFVRAGDRCLLKIEAFEYMEHGTAEGAINWISDNAFTTDDNGQPVDAYYTARCGISAMHFVNVPAKFRLIPGMTLEADVNVGTRSVALYLLGGFLRTLGQSMREP